MKQGAGSPYRIPRPVVLPSLVQDKAIKSRNAAREWHFVYTIYTKILLQCTLTRHSPVDKRALPKWRYNLRQQALPLVRWETPYLAWLQATLRSPTLDSYFAITANLGTHTFFMIGLPIMFWCGNASFGKGYAPRIPAQIRHDPMMGGLI